MNKPLLLAGFAVKVLLGLVYGYIFFHFYNGDDTWKLFGESLAQKELLLNNPGVFFFNEFTPANALETGKNAFDVVIIYLNDLQFVLIVKVMAIMNFVTNGNYYLNAVLFNAILFFGHYWLYLVFSDVFPQKKNLYLIIIFFFLPAVFWLSGIRVDGLLFFFLAMLFRGVTRKNRSWLMAISGFAGTVICRPQVALLVAIAGIGYYLHMRFGRPVVTYCLVYVAAIVIFFLPATNFAGITAEKQNEFSNLKGTKFRLDELEATPASYLQVLPQAAGNTFLRPAPWEAKGFLQLMASAEVVAFWIIFIASVIYRHPFWKVRLFHPVVLALLVLGVTMYLVTGFIVPFPGAIVRYKAIAELLLLCCFASMTRWGDHKNYKKL